MHAAALPLPVTLAVLAAAVTHATWNAIAHGIKDQLLAFGLIGAGGILVAINHRLASPEVEYILGHSGARFLLLDAELEALVQRVERAKS